VNEDRLEKELSERFQRLRAQESARAPDFETMLATARERAASEVERAQRESGTVVPIRRRGWIGPWGQGLAASALAAAAMAVLWLAPTSERGGGAVSGDDFDALVRSYSEQANGGLWRAPTDGLLQVPGIELVRTVPSIGGYEPPEGGRPTGDNG
jgi:hypothetical protein